MKGMKFFFIMLFSASAVFFISCSGMVEDMNSFVENAVYSTPDITDLEDGDYIGKQRVGIVNVKVRVAVRDHEITKIEILKHFNGQGGPAEAIVDDVIAAQGVEVDIITGATYSSSAILKAIENALTVP